MLWLYSLVYICVINLFYFEREQKCLIKECLSFFTGCLVVSCPWHLAVLAGLAVCASLRNPLALPYFRPSCTRLPDVSQTGHVCTSFCISVITEILSKQQGFVHILKVFLSLVFCMRLSERQWDLSLIVVLSFLMSVATYEFRPRLIYRFKIS